MGLSSLNSVLLANPRKLCITSNGHPVMKRPLRGKPYATKVYIHANDMDDNAPVALMQSKRKWEFIIATRGVNFGEKEKWPCPVREQSALESFRGAGGAAMKSSPEHPGNEQCCIHPVTGERSADTSDPMEERTATKR